MRRGWHEWLTRQYCLLRHCLPSAVDCSPPHPYEETGESDYLSDTNGMDEIHGRSFTHPNDYSWVIIMIVANPYKQAWMEKSGRDTTVRPTSRRIPGKRTRYKRKRDLLVPSVEMVQKQIVEQVVLGAAYRASVYASRSQITGKLGIGLRVSGRIGVRVVPVVGAVLLAKDIYDAYQFLTKD